MAAKAFLALCASALLMQTITTQCLGNIGYGNGLGLTGNQVLAAENIGYGVGYNTGLAASGLGCGAGLGSYGLGGLNGNLGTLPVSSASPIAPNGISVLSENAIEGALLAGGTLPFLAGVAFEGELPTAGQAAVSSGCGNGNVGIVSEGLGGVAGLGYGSGLAGSALAGGLGYGAGLANAGLFNAGLGNAGLLNAGLGNAGLLNAGLAGGFGGLRGVGGCGCGGVY